MNPILQEKNTISSTNSVPRRNRLDLNTPAELSIHNAMQEVEEIGANERLTNAIILLQQARDLVSDYVDEIEKPKQFTREDIKDRISSMSDRTLPILMSELLTRLRDQNCINNEQIEQILVAGEKRTDEIFKKA